ncbi:Elongation factor Ts [Clostridiales bacterium CHKCI006]|uniref:Elongation factor Ts n=1 Tax=Candidatus Fimiplasma intestinipullorum TaxID=2840825 RepID=A0A9D1HPW3_9FIRM|nr:Elongation factor Ts [Clostridiales bacterium CHKCI006]HIU14358.1 elongation factor Ts [Candidatus Fimiplasma intestinipullorum]
MAVSAKLVKELREKTGAGMMDCKKALEACDGDLEKSFDWLREKGIAKAAKKADRIAAEGLTAFSVEGNVAAIVEVNSETDFVAKNQEFKDLVQTVVNVIRENKPATMEEALAIDVNGKTLEITIAEASGKIGEKISLRRFEVLNKADDEVFGAYSHMGGKITAVVLVSGSDENKARDVAMHVAASAPQYISREDIPAEVLDREMEVLKAQALEENSKAAKPKPENIIHKMVEGRLNKNLAEMCLVDQAFIKDPDQKVGKYIGNGKVVKMVRYLVGEGMQKREENFAEEVAAQMANK